MKKVLIWVLALILLAVVSVVGTLTFLVDKAEANNVMIAGKVGIQIVEYERKNTAMSNADAEVKGFDGDKLLLPSTSPDDFDYTALDNTTYVDWAQVGKTGYTSPIWDPAKVSNEVDKMVFVENTGTNDAFVRLYFAFEAGNFVRLDRFKQMVHLNLGTEWTWEWIERKDHIADIGGTKCFIAMATCKVPVKAGEHSPISLSQIALDPTAKNGDALAFGEKYDVWVFAQGIQADGFTADLGYTPATAITEAFGTTVPFDGVTYVPLTDLNTALHYRDGVVSDENKITSNVTNVTFSTLKAHPEIAGAHTGMFTANKNGEADYTAYTYYVPNGDNYDIYVLSCGDTVYAPKSSNNLFADMSALKKVGTDTFDVSQVTTTDNMFVGCKQLEEIDTSDWQLPNVTTMNRMFCSCNNLLELDVSGWGITNKLKYIDQIFDGCNALKTLDCSGWDVSNVTTMKWAFRYCWGLTELDVSGWEVGQVVSFLNMFTSCSELTTIPVDTWTWGDSTHTATDMSHMFAGCKSLTSLDLSNWDVDNVSSMVKMFENCSSLTSIDFSGWNTVSLSDINNMFAYCNALTDLNISNWDVTKVTNMHFMFRNCCALKVIDLSGWTIANNVKMNEMFKMELSYGQTQLTTIYVGSGWSPDKIGGGFDMFAGCNSLVGANGTMIQNEDGTKNPVDKTYARVDTADAPGYLTEK